MSVEILEDRELGQFRLSIATSLAFEAAAGIHPDIQVSKAPLLEYDAIWINIKTLYRNMIGALKTEHKTSVTPTDCTAILVDELNLIIETIHEFAKPDIEIVFYVSDYAGLAAKYPFAALRADNTEKQKFYTNGLINTLGLVLKHIGKDNYRTFKNSLSTDSKKKTLILTHCAYDLLSAGAFKELALLESHTGKIKLKHEWYTKYDNGKLLPAMPFRPELLQVFGDSETFRPHSQKLKNEVLELAKKYNWTPLTTNDKIVYSYDQLRNPWAKDLLKSMSHR